MMDLLKVSFICITCLSVISIYLATGKNKRIFLLFFCWLIISGTMSYSGLLRDTHSLPPRFLLIIIPAIIIVAIAYKLVDPERLNLSWLIGLHILRLPVELILFGLYIKDLVPYIMTFGGWNYDILSGVSAIFVLLFYRYQLLNRQLLGLWNWLGICLLAIIVSTAILAAPTPIQQLAFDQPNRAVLIFPFTWLPAVVVPIVLLSHILSLKGRHL